MILIQDDQHFLTRLNKTGETVNRCQVVSTDAKEFELASASSQHQTMNVLGLINDKHDIDDTVDVGRIQTHGVLKATADEWSNAGIMGGLVAGTAYYVSTTPGELTATKPTASGQYVRQVGIAISETELLIDRYAGFERIFHAADIGDKFEARLTLVSGTPIAGANNATTIYLTPYFGNTIRLFDGSAWQLHALSEISIAVPSTLFRRFDVFVWDDAGTLKLQLENFTENTGTITDATNASPVVITSAGHGLSNGNLVGIAGIVGNTAPNTLVWQVANVTTDTFELLSSAGNGAYVSGGTWYQQLVGTGPSIVLQDGIPVLSGSPTRRYIGTGMTQGVSGQTSVNGNGRMLLANEFNQVAFSTSIDDANSHTYTSTTTRAFNNDGSKQAWLVVPRTGWLFNLLIIGNLSDFAQVDAGLNSNSVIFTGTLINDNAEAIRACMLVPVFRNKAVDFFWMVQRSRNGTTGTFEEMQLRGIHTR